MIKSLFISIWAMAVTVGMVLLPGFLESESDSSDPLAPTLIDHRTDTMSAALFEHGTVIGHFTTRIRYQLPEDAIDPEIIPLDQILLDGLFEVIYKSDPKKLAKLQEPELAVMGQKLEHLLNNRSTPIPVTSVRFDRARLMLK